jgi:A/G-specific adenine glycosylase
MPDATLDIQQSLLDWYTLHQRKLPWRGLRDPYGVWVSEIMLQQTRVETVMAYFQRWMAKFPTVEALAGAELADVLKVWEGLGYYSRARNLHKAARVVVTEHGGELPRTVAGLQSLPGVGRYTAGAIASMAMGLDAPAVDGNVARILARVRAIRGDIKSPAVQKRLWQAADKLVPPGRAGEFNQALMDLGSAVCTPRGPECADCPIATNCLAHARGLQGSLPTRVRAKPTPHIDIVVGVILRRTAGRWKLLIARRPESAMLGGLWEFPGGKLQSGETHEQALVREIREEVGLDVAVLGPLCTVKHAYSHFKITLHAYRCRATAGKAKPLHGTAVKWVTLSELPQFAFPRANVHVLTALNEWARSER